MINRLIFILVIISIVIGNDSLTSGLKVDSSSSDIELTDGDIVLDDEIELTDDDNFNDSTSVAEEELAPIEKMPEQTKFVDAVYPKSIYSKGIEGVVTLQLLVNENGNVDSATIISSLNPILDSNAINATLQFKFTPAIAGGEAIPVYIEYEYRFSLDDVVSEMREVVNFSGKLLEAGTRKPIADAMVVVSLIDTVKYTGFDIPIDRYLKKIGSFSGQSLEEGKIVVITDSTGDFSFKSLPIGEVTITVPLVGYEQYVDNETIVKDSLTNITLRLTKLSYNDYEVTAYYKGDEKEVSRRNLSINEVKKIPGLGGDAIKVIQALPGVARPTAGSGAVVVRGAPSWDSKFYLDGTEFPLLYHFGGLKSTYNSEALESIDFYPGGFGTRYGNVVGGVVEVHTREAAKDKWHTVLDVSTLDASFFTEGPVNDKVSLMFSGRRSYFGEILNWSVNTFDIKLGATVTPFYWDYISRVDIDISKKNHLAFSSFGSYDSLEMFINNVSLGNDELNEATNAIRNKMFFNKASVNWRYDISDRITNSLDNSWDFLSSEQAIFGFMRMDNLSNSWNFRDNLGIKLGDKLTLNVGADGNLDNTDLTSIIMDGNGLTQKDTINNWKFGNIAAYTNLEFKPIDKLLIIPGIRYDYYRELSHNGGAVPEYWNYGSWNNKGISGDPSFRLATRFKVTKNQTIKGAIGNYNQTPQPFGQAIHPKWGEPSLPTTKATHFVLGDEYQFTDLISLDIQGYYNNQWDIPRSAGSGDITPNTDSPLWLPDGEGRSYGLEIMLRHNQSDHFFGWVAYTLSRSERRKAGEEEYSLFSKDQTHNLQILGSWKLRKQWEAGFRMRYTTGNPSAPVTSKTWDVDNDYMAVNYGPNTTERLDPFFQIDARIEKQFILPRSIMVLYLDIQNLSYFIYKSPDFKMWDDFYIESTDFVMPIIPALGFQIKF